MMEVAACKHMVAKLFSLIEWGKRHCDRSTAVCTYNNCGWDNPRNGSQLMKLEDISMADRNRIHPNIDSFKFKPYNLKKHSTWRWQYSNL